MRVDCPKCGHRYDDAQRWTICPHNRLEASPDGDGRGVLGGGYCEEHDLFNCPNHAPDGSPAVIMVGPAWRQEAADRLDAACATDTSAAGINRAPSPFWETGPTRKDPSLPGFLRRMARAVFGSG